MTNPMIKLDNEIPTEEELHDYLIDNLGLLSSGYASEYPGCETFCKKAIGTILESLNRLNQLPRIDPFWTNTNRRPTIHKLDDYCNLLLQGNDQDTLAIWTLAALDVSRGIDGFGCQHWQALHDQGNFDVTWPICAALLQGGPAGISDRALAMLLSDIEVVETAQPVLQSYVASARPNISAWATRVLDRLHEASAS